MTFGIDISSLQGPHRMRGIGYTLINFINNLSPEDRKNRFVFYSYPDSNIEEVLGLLDLEGLEYELRELEQPKRSRLALPGMLRLLTAAINQWHSLMENYRGDSRIKDLSGVDIFVQTDQAISVPRGHKVRKALVLYDLIPHILEWDYMWGYKTARRHSFSRRAALRCAARRIFFAHKTRVNCRRADILLAISETTKVDFIKYIGVKPKKIKVVPLGINPPSANDSSAPSHRYVSTSWGYIKQRGHFDLDTPYLLFVGGADSRRKLEDLVTAFNHLRAKGSEVKLVLAGDSMQGPNNISTSAVRRSLLGSSYIDDIIFLGFISDGERDWLYRHALAFVFPSRYEGFGLPVLEAMSYGCPVIAYKNVATAEIASELPLYADGFADIEQAADRLLNDDAYRQSKIKAGLAHASQYSWQKTVSRMVDLIS